MTTTLEKLNEIAEIKADIKSAIIAKGGAIESTDTFADYATRFSELMRVKEIDANVQTFLIWLISDRKSDFYLQDKHLVGVTDFGRWTFAYCNGLKTINFSNVEKITGYAPFMYCEKLTTASLGNVSSINSATFLYCTLLTSITLNSAKDSISGSPWGATNATVTWLG